MVGHQVQRYREATTELRQGSQRCGWRQDARPPPFTERAMSTTRKAFELFATERGSFRLPEPERLAVPASPHDAPRRDTSEAEALLASVFEAMAPDGMSFRRQHVIAGFRVDFYCETAGLAIELRTATDGGDSEGLREAILLGLGVRLLRLRAADVLLDPMIALDLVRQAAQRGPGPRYVR